MFIFLVQLTTSRIGNLTRLILTLATCDDHTYIHTYIHTHCYSIHTSLTTNYTYRLLGTTTAKGFCGVRVASRPASFRESIPSWGRASPLYPDGSLPVVTKDLPISPRFTPYNFLSRCKFNSSTNGWILLTHVPTLPLRKKEHESYFGKNRTHDFRTSRCAGYLLDHSGDIYYMIYTI